MRPAEVLVLEAEDEARFWALLEAAWVPPGPDIRWARQTLAVRDAGISLVTVALPGFLDALAGHCRRLPGKELAGLDRVLERKLYGIGRADIHSVIDGSDDGFLHVRGFIVAMGQDFYEAVNNNPESVPGAECEEMCYFFAYLYRERSGDFPDTGSEISRESCSNPADWGPPSLRFDTHTAGHDEHRKD